MRITPARLAVTYVAVAATWILLSDAVVDALRLPDAIETPVNVLKGWGFVLFTGFLLLLLARALVGQAEQRERRLALLHRIDASILAAESPQALASAAVDEVRALLDADRVLVAAYDRDRVHATVLAVSGGDAGIVAPPGTRLRIDALAAPALVDRLEPTVVRDLAELGGELVAAPDLLARGLHAAAFFPLRGGTTSEGSMTVLARSATGFTASGLAIAAEVADQLAIALRQARLRDELADRESRLAAILEASPNPIFTLDEDGVVGYANPAADRTFGATPPGLAGRPIQELVPDEARERHTQAIQAWFAGQAPSVTHPVHVRARRLDGSTFPVEVLLAPVDTGERRHAIATLVDLSDREALEARLRQGERLETLGQFAGTLAHDVRNYLTAMSWSAEMLAGGLPEDDPRYPDVDLIRRAAAGALDMTRSVLEFARPTTDVAGRTDVPAHLSQVVALLRPLVEPGIDVRVDCPEHVPAAAIAPQALTQVLVNLATNARDAMPDGGSLVLEAADVDIPAGAEGLLRPGRHVRIRVTDTGTGMDPATRERAFDAFFTTKAAAGTGSGTGLGLSSVYLIVTRAGGSVDIAPGPDAGTVVTLHLPVAA